MTIAGFLTGATAATALFAVALGCAPATAGPAASFAAPQRPSLGSSGAVGMAATLGAIVEAELAAKEQMAQSAANPFLKPRPRPNRENIALPKEQRPAGGAISPVPAE